jgi:ABC-2 type transport system ATP-binding protein
MSSLLRFNHVSKAFGSTQALSNVTAHLTGRAIGLVGPNGAGKTTLMKLCLGLLIPDSGSVSVLDAQIEDGAHRARLGFAAEGTGHLPELTGLECVAYAAELCGFRRRAALLRAHEMLDLVGLDEARYRPAENYSTGMLQRAKVAMALAHGPDLLLLDEPTSGLDPESRSDFLDLLQHLAEGDGPAIVLSTHILHDVERACDGCLMLQDGMVRYSGPLDDLKVDHGRRYIVRPMTHVARLETALGSIATSVESPLNQGVLEVHLNANVGVEAIWQRAAEVGVEIVGLESAPWSFEEAFLSKLGESDG